MPDFGDAGAGPSPALIKSVINRTAGEKKGDDEFVAETRVIRVKNRRAWPGGACRLASTPTVAQKAATPTLNDQSASAEFCKWLKRIFGW